MMLQSQRRGVGQVPATSCVVYNNDGSCAVASNPSSVPDVGTANYGTVSTSTQTGPDVMSYLTSLVTPATPNVTTSATTASSSMSTYLIIAALGLGAVVLLKGRR